ncbi:hypothetical protein BK139_00845 [Paenibacillus sp. FSL R5-0490]|nr:hypothetical protein BK139_00845 [Paenibacillus sp. FSL R5-0490]
MVLSTHYKIGFLTGAFLAETLNVIVFKEVLYQKKRIGTEGFTNIFFFSPFFDKLINFYFFIG